MLREFGAGRARPSSGPGKVTFWIQQRWLVKHDSGEGAFSRWRSPWTHCRKPEIPFRKVDCIGSLELEKLPWSDFANWRWSTTGIFQRLQSWECPWCDLRRFQCLSARRNFAHLKQHLSSGDPCVDVVDASSSLAAAPCGRRFFCITLTGSDHF